MVDTRPSEPLTGFPQILEQDKVVPWPGQTAQPREALAVRALPFLVESLKNPSDPVKMWAAFQLANHHQEQVPDFLETLWECPLEEVRELAVHLTEQHSLDSFGFPLLRLFSSARGDLKQVCGVALGRLKYAPASKSLEGWFDQAFANEEGPRNEKEAAAQALLHAQGEKGWDKVYQAMNNNLGQQALYSELFRMLCRHVENSRQIKQINQAYRAPRTVLHDAGFVSHFYEIAGRKPLSRFVQAGLHQGLGLHGVYREVFSICGLSPDPALEAMVERLAGCGPTADGVARFLSLAPELMRRLGPPRLGRTGRLAAAFLKNAHLWAGEWEETILKVREAEYFHLVALPLETVVEQAERKCLKDPKGQALVVANLYQSPLLGHPFMREVLALLGEEQSRSALELADPSGGWLWDDEKKALWKLFTGQMEGVDYPFERVLPQPWNHQLPSLMARLGQVMEKRLGYYLAADRRQAVDYALEVLRRSPRGDAVEVVLGRFDQLMANHYNALLDYVANVPDRRFVGPLTDHYKSDDPELGRLIRFVCDVNLISYPSQVGHTPQPERPPVESVRLVCQACGQPHHYPVGEVYVNVERLEQRQIPTVADLWRVEALCCQGCAQPLPFEPDQVWRQELYNRLLALRILKLEGGGEGKEGSVKVVHFPLMEGLTVHPDHFLAVLRGAELSAKGGGAEARRRLAGMRFELGRFYLEMGRLEEARQTFERVTEAGDGQPLALYYLGVIAFQEKNLFQARVHFSRLTQLASRDDFGRELDNPVDMAHHYLKLLDRPEFRRSQFTVVTTRPENLEE